jgi:hypothetical protein
METETLSLLVSALGLVVSCVALLIASLAAFFTWWAPRSVYVRQRINELAPAVTFWVSSSSGGGGITYTVMLRDLGRGPARRLTVTLPDAEPLSVAELWPDRGAPFVVPIPDRAAVLTQPREGLVARVSYEDEFGLRYEAWRDLVQVPRTDGLFHVALPPKLPERAPSRSPVITGWVAWRLRNRV